MIVWVKQETDPYVSEKGPNFAVHRSLELNLASPLKLVVYPTQNSSGTLGRSPMIRPVLFDERSAAQPRG